MQCNARVCNVQRRPTNARVSPPRGNRCTLRVQYTLKHSGPRRTDAPNSRTHCAISAGRAACWEPLRAVAHARAQACGPSWCSTRHTTSSGSCRRGNRCTASRMPQWPHRPQKRRPKGFMALAPDLLAETAWARPPRLWSGGASGQRTALRTLEGRGRQPTSDNVAHECGA
jgi:hypothetical protein